MAEDEQDDWMSKMGVSEFMPTKHRRQMGAEQGDLLPKMDLPPITPEAVERKAQEYLQDFDTTTTTRIDLSQLTNLARLSLNIEALNMGLSRATEGIYTTGQVRTLATSLKEMMAEERQQADALGISRSKRISGQQSELEQYLPKLKKQVKDLMGDRIILMLCPKCLKEPAHVEIRQGMIIYHFMKENRKWSWNGECVRCGENINITHKNYKDFLLNVWDKPILAERDKIETVDIEDIAVGDYQTL